MNAFSWHGNISHKGGVIYVKNFIQCYQHEISLLSFTSEDETRIVDCKSSWNYIYVLFYDGNVVRFPWRKNLRPEHFKWLQYPKKLKWTDLSPSQTVSVLTVELAETDRFSHFGLQKLRTNKHLANSKFLLGCTDNSAYLVDNYCSETSILYCIDTPTSVEPYSIHLNLPSNVKIAQITCGKAHVALLNTSGCMDTFGVGTKGELGHGTTDCLQAPKLVEALLGLKIKQIATGGWHTAALTEFGDLYLWGWNANSQLGLDKTQISVVSEPTFIQIEGNTEMMIKNIACASKSTAILTENNEVFTSGVIRYEPNEELKDISAFTKIDTDCEPTDIKMNDWSLFLIHN